jgi:hypothetical protein
MPTAEGLSQVRRQGRRSYRRLPNPKIEKDNSISRSGIGEIHRQSGMSLDSQGRKKGGEKRLVERSNREEKIILRRSRVGAGKHERAGSGQYHGGGGGGGGVEQCIATRVDRWTEWVQLFSWQEEEGGTHHNTSNKNVRSLCTAEALASETQADGTAMGLRWACDGPLIARAAAARCCLIG